MLSNQILAGTAFDINSDIFFHEDEIREFMENKQAIPQDFSGNAKMEIIMENNDVVRLQASPIVLAFLLEDYEYAEFLMDMGNMITPFIGLNWHIQNDGNDFDDSFNSLFGGKNTSLMWIVFGKYDHVPKTLMKKLLGSFSNSAMGNVLYMNALNQNIVLSFQDISHDSMGTLDNEKNLNLVLDGMGKAMQEHSEIFSHWNIDMHSVGDVNIQINLLDKMVSPCERINDVGVVIDRYIQGYQFTTGYSWEAYNYKVNEKSFEKIDHLKKLAEQDKKVKEKLNQLLLCISLELDEKQVKEYRERVFPEQIEFAANSRIGKKILKKLLLADNEFDCPCRDCFDRFFMMVDRFTYSRNGKMDEKLLRELLENTSYDMIIHAARKGLINDASIPQALEICFENNLKQYIPCFIFIKNSQKFQRM